MRFGRMGGRRRGKFVNFKPGVVGDDAFEGFVFSAGGITLCTTSRGLRAASGKGEEGELLDTAFPEFRAGESTQRC